MTMNRKRFMYSSFATGSATFLAGVLLTQVPGKDHSVDSIFLISSMLLLGCACCLMVRWRPEGFLARSALTIAVFELLVSVYALISILTYRHY